MVPWAALLVEPLPLLRPRLAEGWVPSVEASLAALAGSTVVVAEMSVFDIRWSSWQEEALLALGGLARIVEA